MRYQITYESTYRYSAPVVGNFNRLRMRPRSDGTQRCEHFDISVTPNPDRLATYQDLFGNEVTEVLVAAPLQRLRIQIDATVATTEPMPPPEGSWADLQTDRYRRPRAPTATTRTATSTRTPISRISWTRFAASRLPRP